MYYDIVRMLSEKTKKLEIPFAGMFELTAKCNLHCRFCYVCDREKKGESQPEKSTVEWLDMIRQAASAGMLKCSFTGGDPFIRDDFEEIYCKTYDMGLRISILTNGILIGERQRDYLSRRVPDLISVSLYGASEVTYQTVSGDGANYHRVLASLDGLRQSGFAFEIKVLAMQPLFSEYEALGHIAAKYQCPGKIDAYMCPGRDEPKRLIKDWRMPPNQIKEAIQHFKKPQHLMVFEKTMEQVTPGPQKSTNAVFNCAAGKNGFFITHDGRLLGCPSLSCFSAYPFRDGFDHAWQSLKEMINNAAGCDECLICPAYGKCFICPADRLSETGSITRCSPYLAQMVDSLIMLDEKATS